MARLISYLGNFERNFSNNARNALTEMGFVTANEGQRLMTESPRSGKFYARGRRRMKRGAKSAASASRFPRASSIHARFAAMARTVFHRASGPGEPPAVDTGALRNSVTSEVQVTPRGFEARVGTPLKTGRWTEFGTTLMAARPWLRPAVNNMRPRYPEIARKHFSRGGGGPGPAAASAAVAG